MRETEVPYQDYVLGIPGAWTLSLGGLFLGPRMAPLIVMALQKKPLIATAKDK